MSEIFIILFSIEPTFVAIYIYIYIYIYPVYRCFCRRVMSPSAETVCRRLMLLMLLTALLSSPRAVDANEMMRTTCFHGYFNLLRCSPWISWLTTFVVSSCQHKCKATGKHQYGACVRQEVSCLSGTRLLYVCHCTTETD